VVGDSFLPESIILRSLADLVVIAIAVVSVFYAVRYRKPSIDARARRGSLWIVGGLAAMGLYHLVDLLRLGGTPIAPNYQWVIVAASVSAIALGVAMLRSGLAAQVESLQKTQAELTRELDAHRETGQALNFSVRRFAEIVNIASAAIISADRDQNIQLFNKGAEEIFGYSVEDVLGKPLDMLLPDRFKGAHRGHLEQFLAAPEASRLMNQRGRVIGLRKNGGEFPAEASISKVESEGDTVFTVILHDVSRREQREAQLRHAQGLQAVGQLTGGVAHDFNNLLAIILGNLELAAEELDPPSQPRELISRAIAAADRGAALTARLLAFSRRQALEPKVVDINKLVLGMTELLQRTLGETIDIETVTAAGLWRTKVDPAQLENVLINMAVNARDAMPEGGKLTIETANARLDEDYAAAHTEVTPGQYVLLAVTDDGVGMPPEIVERAFEPFFTTKNVGQGTGLGLSMIYGLVKQSGGHVKIYSEPDHGTTVKVYLPRSREPESLTEAEPPLDVHDAESLETILVVEDDAEVRRLAMSVLKSLGYTALEADDAESALAVLKQRPEIALLFTDVVLPGGVNGAQLARQALERYPDLKVLYTSGYTDNAIVHRGVLDSGAEMIGKPFRKAALARKLRSILDRGESTDP
jgi:PAS domain S-box-containing protein